MLLTRILYSVTPGPAMIRAVCEYSRLILITVVIFVFLNDCRFLGWTSWKSRFNSALILQKKPPFRSEIMRYNDLEQTNTLFLRENRNQNTSIKFCECYLHTCRLNQLGTHGCSRISILISVILNSLLRILSHVFYSSHSAYYVWLCSFLKLMQPSDLEA